MKIDLSSRDWQNLSEYLDHKLSPDAQQWLEARLQSDVSLQTGLEALSRSRIVLRSTPKIRCPRSFTLTPEMVGKRATASAFPMLRLASLVASIILVVVLAGDLILGRSIQPVGQTTETLLMETSTEEVSAQLVEMAAPEADMNAESPPAELRAAGATSATPPVPSAKMQPEPSQVSPEDQKPELEVAVAEELSQLPTEDALHSTWSAAEQGEARQSQRSLLPLQVIRLAEIVLAVIALGTGVAAFYLRRMGRI